MWFSRGSDVEWHALIASAALLFLLYEVQALILFRIRSMWLACSVYALVVAATVPVCWGMSPDWYNPNADPLATFVGWPVAIHMVPLFSFERGLTLRHQGRLKRWWIEALVHLTIVVPVWMIAWGLFEMFCLDLYWI